MKVLTIIFCFILITVTIVLAGPAIDSKSSDNHQNLVQQPSDYNQFEEGLLKKLNSKCTQRDVKSCVMLNIINYINRMLKKASIDVNNEIEITKTTTVVKMQETARSLPSTITSMSEEAQITQVITDKVWDFIRSRQLKYKLFDDADLVFSANPSDKDGSLNFGVSIKTDNSIEGRGKKGNMGGILAALAMKAGLIGALAFKALVLLVGKALILSKIALLLATIIGLKKLFSQEKHVTYEVVPHPHHSHSHVESSGGHDSYSGGWGRSLTQNNVVQTQLQNNAQDIAYKAQKPAGATS